MTIDLKGPRPEDMKPGEIYKVVQEKNALQLQKVETAEPERKVIIEIELSEYEYRLWQLEATGQGMKPDEYVQKVIKDLIEQLVPPP